MEPTLASLGFCAYHPSEKISLLCTKSTCKISRLLCFKCNYLKSHPECEQNLIMIEDLNSQKFTDSLRNWVKDENDRKTLNLLEAKSKNQNKNIDSILQELDEFLEKRFSQLIVSISQRLLLEKEKILAKSKKMLGEHLVEDHFSIKTLCKILEMKNDEKNKILDRFFAIELKDFLKLQQNEVSFDTLKVKIENLMNSMEGILTNMKLPPIQLINNEKSELIRFKKSSPNSWGYSNDVKKVDCLTFKVNQKIWLEGVSIFVAEKDETSGWLQVLQGDSADSKNVLTKKEFKFVRENEEKSRFIELEKTVEVEKNVKYTLCLKMIEGRSCSGSEGSSLVSFEGKDFQISFSFFKSCFENSIDNGTSEKNGQFEKFYFSY